MINVVIADDQALIRDSLKIVLSMDDNINVVGTASNGLGVLDLLKKEYVDVILMDIRMPKMDGVLCTKQVKKDYPKTKVIVLTTFDDEDFVFSALRYGASGYLLKGVSMDELTAAIKTVHSGGAMLNPDIAAKVFSMFSKRLDEDTIIQVDDKAETEISRTEWKVIQQVGRGRSNKEIAAILYLSEGTVRNYLSSILNKFSLRDRTQLAIWAVENRQKVRDMINKQ
ncbi:MAG: response regulator transcription factor [Allobaculum sp.]|nr:response regulator transcription factor [Allobaculum sp.]